ncbi:DUF3231 family protein [Bacillus sp. FJAT-27251]|uniref:DUF3231 family protein n=1 Tax=Bacillus sp. FJAT-27251 TaxID=1684142 RepID=UPI0006A7EBF7|nr:DUF3231 family protein [Bacillus sp. FJAT-27251]
MNDKTQIPLTAAEMSTLWTQYINDTLASCVGNYFLEKVEDEEVRPIIIMSLDIAARNLSIMKDLFNKENFPIPLGFTNEDVIPKAPRLFTDSFVLMYLRQMSILAMAANSAALGVVTRADVVDFHKSVLTASVKLQDVTRELMLKQGTYIRPPVLPIPDKVDFVEKQQFLSGFFGPKRALTSTEVTHLFLNIQTNSIGKALITGLAQVAEREDIKQYLLRGKQLATKHVKIFGNFLIKEDLPAPMSWETAVTDSTAKVFSDKLILFHVLGMIAAGVGNYGMAMAASPRRDLAAQYASLIPEISFYAEDGANLLIKHGWMEEPPQAEDRNKLITE